MRSTRPARVLRDLRWAGSRDPLRAPIIEAVKPLDLNARVGVHIGEVQVDGRSVEGANVHLAARVMSEAKSGEVLVSEAVRDLLAGSEMHLTDRGRERDGNDPSLDIAKDADQRF